MEWANKILKLLYNDYIRNKDAHQIWFQNKKCEINVPIYDTNFLFTTKTTLFNFRFQSFIQQMRFRTPQYVILIYSESQFTHTHVSISVFNKTSPKILKKKHSIRIFNFILKDPSSLFFFLNNNLWRIRTKRF
jgi:hypothetical protein